MVECKECGTIALKPVSESWDFGYCPQCVSCKNLPDIKLEILLHRKEVNPIDMYWNLLTVREMAMQARAK